MFTGVFDIVHALLIDVRNAQGRKLKFLMFTDSKQVFDFVKRRMRLIERHSVIGVSVAHEAYIRYKIVRDGLVRSRENLANARSKIGGMKVQETLIENGLDTTHVQEWISCTRNGPHSKESGSCVDL